MKSLIIFVILAVLLGCTSTPDSDVFDVETKERRKPLMGTVASVRLPKEEVDLSKRVFQQMAEVERLFSNYREDSILEELHRKRKMRVPKTFADLLNRSLQLQKQTEGKFDIRVASLSKTHYGFGTSNGAQKPEQEQLQKRLQQLQRLQVEVSGNRVSLIGSGELDFGGIGKGFAVDQAVKIIENKEIKPAVVALSGDISCLGQCRMAIQSPWEKSKKLVEFRFKGPRLAVSTSGTYEKKSENAPEIHHLLQTKSGKPSTHLISVSLMATGDNTLIDALATAAAVSTVEGAMELLKKYPRVSFVLVGNDKVVYVSDSFLNLAGEANWTDEMADFRIIKQAESNKSSNRIKATGFSQSSWAPIREMRGSAVISKKKANQRAIFK